MAKATKVTTPQGGAQGNTFNGPVAHVGNAQAQAAALHAWLASVGGPNNVTIKTLPTASGPHPLPFSNMGAAPGTGKRAQILWALVNGVPIKGQPNSRTLTAYLNYSKGLGASGQLCLDLFAALNGGFSPAARNTWGTAYVQLVANGQPAKAAKPKPAKPSVATQPAAPAPAPVAPPAPTPVAPPAPVSTVTTLLPGALRSN